MLGETHGGRQSRKARRDRILPVQWFGFPSVVVGFLWSPQSQRVLGLSPWYGRGAETSWKAAPQGQRGQWAAGRGYSYRTGRGQ